MKIKPVLDSLEQRGVDVILVHTGQHYDPAMSDVFFEELGLRRPDVHLGVGSGTHAEQTARVMVAFEGVVEEHRPDWVTIAGDVNSTVACALVGAKAGCYVAHVEAGLRSRDWTMPEEVNRVVTDRLSDLLLAPSADAVENLRAEGYREDQIVLAGNVMVDTLLANIERAQTGSSLRDFGLEPYAYGVITLHRPANVDDQSVLAPLLGALGTIAQSCPLVFPVHPRAEKAVREIGVPDGIRLLPPQGYLAFLALQASARIVLTDSGGIQEETTVLGVPCVTLRDNTERPITITEGTNVLAGRDPDRVVSVATRVLGAPPQARRPPLWDGHAADRIADAIAAIGPVAASRHRRPTELSAT
jgi:UDP-N-acetylglucosamine 2-epimerase (non-hydrolysing)